MPGSSQKIGWAGRSGGKLSMIVINAVLEDVLVEPGCLRSSSASRPNEDLEARFDLLDRASLALQAEDV
jgi:hypothetical protein